MKLGERGRMRARRFDTEPLRITLRKRAEKEAPLVDMPHGGTRSGGFKGYCDSLGITHSILYRPHLTDWTVDRICIAAGLHPSEVYPDWDRMSERLTEEMGGVV